MDSVSVQHWFRPEPEKASSSIFWIIVLPDGMLVHTCTTAGLVHDRSTQLFFKDAHLLFLTELLIEELQSRDPHCQEVSHNCLMNILYLVERALLNERAFHHLAQAAITGTVGDSALVTAAAPQDVFRRACAYIETHIHESLSPVVIAQHTAISPAQLNRVFRQVGGTSVMRHVTAHRVTVAQLLLEQTQLPVNEIATIIGIPDRAVFNHAFRRATGLSPSEYRKPASSKS
jgi:AraC-like DNA-binding protein